MEGTIWPIQGRNESKSTYSESNSRRKTCALLSIINVLPYLGLNILVRTVCSKNLIISYISIKIYSTQKLLPFTFSNLKTQDTGTREYTYSLLVKPYVNLVELVPVHRVIWLNRGKEKQRRSHLWHQSQSLTVLMPLHSSLWTFSWSFGLNSLVFPVCPCHSYSVSLSLYQKNDQINKKCSSIPANIKFLLHHDG